MKRVAFAFFTLSFIILSAPTQAQFFKKLKKAVRNTARNISTEMNEDDNTIVGNPEEGNILSGPTTTDLSYFHPYLVYKLKGGEKFDFMESCLALEANVITPQIVIARDGERYLIGKNESLIPVKDNNIHGCSIDGNPVGGMILDFKNYAYNAPNVNSGASKDFEKLYVHYNSGVTATSSQPDEKEIKEMQEKLEREKDSGTLDLATVQELSAKIRKGYKTNDDPVGASILFNGKKYGVYYSVQDMMVNSDKTQFVALVKPYNSKDPGELAEGCMIVTSGGAKKYLNFSRGTILPYGDFNHYRIYGQNSDGSSFVFNPENGEKISLPDLGENFTGIDKTTGAIIQLADSKIYVDGKALQNIPEGVQINRHNIYVSRDHKRCAFWTYKGLFLSDGKVIDGVLSCRVEVKDGKNILTWMVLGSDNKTLILCHEAF